MPHNKLKEIDAMDHEDSSATPYHSSFGSMRRVNEDGSPYISPFESIRRVNEEGLEYWSARDLAKILGYARWDKFRSSIQKAEIACENSGQLIQNHFSHVGNMVDIGSGARREIEDVHLSRYACYLVIQNADPSKEIVALGQTYFAIQTHRQEQADELTALSENQRRLYLRGQLTDHNRQLAEAASQAGVIKPLDFAIFQDHGYMGLYGGLRAKEIHIQKGLKKSQQILDYMGSTELAANLFRATQTEEKIRREGINSKEKANRTHFEVGRKVRQTIEELGGTMPEDLPTPKESIQQIQQQEQKRLKQAPQLAMFEESSETDS
jgi:DNA-damage-inducible protein D